MTAARRFQAQARMPAVPSSSASWLTPRSSRVVVRFAWCTRAARPSATGGYSTGKSRYGVPGDVRISA